MIDTLIIATGLLVGQPDTAKTIDYIEIREQVIQRSAEDLNDYDRDRECQHLRFKQFDTTAWPMYYRGYTDIEGTDWC